MPRTKGQLQYHATKLGLSIEGSNDELMNRIRDHMVQTMRLNILPQFPVMLARNAKDFLDYNLDKPWRSAAMMAYWNDPNWVVQSKLNGVHVKAHFHPQYDISPRMDSRRRSDANYIYTEASSNFPHLWVPKSALPPDMQDMILTGELVPPDNVHQIWDGVKWISDLQIVTSMWNSGPEVSQELQKNCLVHTPQLVINQDGTVNNAIYGCKLFYRVFDIVRFGGKWVNEESFATRDGLVELVSQQLEKVNPYYHKVETVSNNKLEYFEKFLMGGGEGVMFKKRDSVYEFGKRTWTMLKMKRFQEISAFITGFVPATVGKAWENYIGAFEASVYNGDNPVHVVSCSAMSMELRKEATVLVDGKPTLNPSFLRRVIECRFQIMTTRNYRGQHAVMIRFRDDQVPADCTYDQLGANPSEMMDGLDE